LHGRATAQLNSLLYDGSVALQVAALPEPFTPLRWTAIVETPNDYRSVALNPLGQVDMQAARIWYKPALTAALKDAKSTEPFRYFLYFARFPVWSVQPVEMNGDRANRVDLTDLRFGVPGAGSFHCVAVADSQGRVREARFTYGSGAQLGWGRDESTQ